MVEQRAATDAIATISFADWPKLLVHRVGRIPPAGAVPANTRLGFGTGSSTNVILRQTIRSASSGSHGGNGGCLRMRVYRTVAFKLRWIAFSARRVPNNSNDYGNDVWAFRLGGPVIGGQPPIKIGSPGFEI